MGSLKPGKEIIYESPDNGETIYGRYAGTNQKWLVGYSKEKKSTIEQIQEDKLWGEIRREAQKNPTLQEALDRAKIIYELSKST